jgi:methyl-accepting chemotaxis protein
MAATSRLRTTILGAGIPGAIVLIGVGAWAALRYTSSQIEHAVLEAMQAAARRGMLNLSAFLADQRRDLYIIARAPTVIAAARDAGREAERLGLPAVPAEALEDRYAERRLLSTDPAVRRYLEAVRDSSGFADLLLADAHGYGVTAAAEPLRFVHAAEAWWTTAMRDGWALGDPQFDEVARAAALELAVRVEDPATGRPVGVLRGPVRLAAARLAGVAGDADVLEVVDTAGRVVLTHDSTRILRPSPVARILPRGEARATVLRAPLGGDRPWVIVAIPDISGRWWSVVRAPEAVALAGARNVRLIIGGAGGAVLAAVIVGLWVFARWLDQRISRPLEAAAVVAQRVAAGDLTTAVPALAAGAGEVHDLLEGLRTMVNELRTLVTGIRGSSEELAAMAQQISASTEEMSASTEEMASTSQRLSDQATEQARQTKGAAADAERILAIGTQLAEGAKLAAERSGELRTTAEGHRGRLVTGSERLAKLAAEVEQGARDAETLAGLSEEIQQFVTQAKTIATRTNMLALNAAIEAARAGTEGQGFAVVADEVRKLASQAAQAAQSTSDTVGRVLHGVQATRERLRRLAGESAAVREIADAAAHGLEDITGRAVENSAWADEIAAAAGEAKQLVEEITVGLRTVSENTEAAVAAIEQIAASAEQQSASTQEVASSAAHLAEASEHLNAGVSRFRLSDQA